MAKSREEKVALKKLYTQFFEEFGGFVAVDINKLDNLTATQLKKDLAEVGSKFMVVKNSIFKIAANEADQPIEVQNFEEATAVIGFTNDPVSPVKLVKKILEEAELLQPKFAVLEGQYLGAEDALRLADIGTREELIAKMLGSLNAPLTGFMNAITGNVRGFVQVLKQLSEKEA